MRAEHFEVFHSWRFSDFLHVLLFSLTWIPFSVSLPCSPLLHWWGHENEMRNAINRESLPLRCTLALTGTNTISSNACHHGDAFECARKVRSRVATLVSVMQPAYKRSATVGESEYSRTLYQFITCFSDWVGNFCWKICKNSLEVGDVTAATGTWFMSVPLGTLESQSHSPETSGSSRLPGRLCRGIVLVVRFKNRRCAASIGELCLEKSVMFIFKLHFLPF